MNVIKRIPGPVLRASVIAASGLFWVLALIAIF